MVDTTVMLLIFLNTTLIKGMLEHPLMVGTLEQIMELVGLVQDTLETPMENQSNMVIMQLLMDMLDNSKQFQHFMGLVGPVQDSKKTFIKSLQSMLINQLVLPVMRDTSNKV